MSTKADQHNGASPLDGDDKNLELLEIEAAPQTTAIQQTLSHNDDLDKGYRGKKTHSDAMSVWQALKAYKRISLLCSLAAASAICDGFQGHFNGSIVANLGFIRQFSGGGTKLDAYWVGVWGGTASAGGVVAPFLIPFVSDRFGRMPSLWITLLILTVSTTLESFVTNNVGWLFAKLVSGIGIAAMQATLPMYLAEMAPVQLRGLFTQAYTFAYVIGQLLSSVPLNWYSQYDPYNFRTPIRIQYVLSGLLIIAYLFMPETPWYHMMKGRIDVARRHYEKYYGHVPGFDIDEQLAVMINTLDQERQRRAARTTVFNFDIFRDGNFKRYVISSWPKLLQQVCGLSLFNSYATYFFNTAGYKNPFEITVIQSCVQIISMIITMCLIDVWGRRQMTVYGYIITVISDFALGATGFADVTTNKPVAGLLVFFACLCNFSTTSASAIGYTYLTEIPRQDLRAKNAAWGLVFNAPIGITLSYCTPLMINTWVQKTGFFFGCFGGICAVVGWFIIPETARRAPAEIDEMFEKKVPLRKWKGYVTDVQIELAARERELGLEMREQVNTAQAAYAA